jgi:hypothetical protein
MAHTNHTQNEQIGNLLLHDQAMAIQEELDLVKDKAAQYLGYGDYFHMIKVHAQMNNRQFFNLFNDVFFDNVNGLGDEKERLEVELGGIKSKLFHIKMANRKNQ